MNSLNSVLGGGGRLDCPHPIQKDTRRGSLFEFWKQAVHECSVKTASSTEIELLVVEQKTIEV